MRYHTTSEGNVPFTAEEEAARDTEESIFAANANNRKAAEIRAERNAKITACDWRVLPDVSNSDVWKTYRQALRDVTNQAGFPWTITWPDAP